MISENPQTAALRQTLSEILQLRFQKWKAWDISPKNPDGERIPYTKLLRIVEEQHFEHLTWLPERCFYLTHSDFYPRNIMARIVNDHSVEVTGILDWDLATIAPAVMAFQPPCWLWNYETYIADEYDFSMTVRTREHYAATRFEEKQIRAAFEARAGFEITKYASNSDSRLAKNLWDLASTGFDDCMKIDLALEVVERWEAGKEQSGDGEQGS